MACRVTRYDQAFEDVLGMKIDDNIKVFCKKMEDAGHTEKSIAFVIWRKQDKLLAFKKDKRFFTVLESEIRKWSWPKGDPRWDEYWKRKNEADRAARVRKEIDNLKDSDFHWELLNSWGKKPLKKAPGYVYFIQGSCGGAIKIGYSNDPESRLKSLQTGYPDTLVLLLMIPGYESHEKALHRELEASRLKGEWFRPDPDVINKIKELTDMFKKAKQEANA